MIERDEYMKNLRQVSSVILWLVLVWSTVFNALYMFNVIGWGLTRVAIAVFFVVLFIISALGLILKDIRKEDAVSLNIITPVREIGRVYVWTLIAWFISISVIFLLRWHIVRFYGLW